MSNVDDTTPNTVCHSSCKATHPHGHLAPLNPSTHSFKGPHNVSNQLITNIVWFCSDKYKNVTSSLCFIDTTKFCRQTLAQIQRPCSHIIFCLSFQPQLRSRSQKQSPTQTLRSNHQASLPPHRPCPQEQDPYQTKATLPHIWTRARTVLVLLWPNRYTTDTLAHFARPLQGLLRQTCGVVLKAWRPSPPVTNHFFPFPYVRLLGGTFFWFISHSVSTILCSGGFTMWK